MRHPAPNPVAFRQARPSDGPALRLFEAQNADHFAIWVPRRPSGYLSPGIIERSVEEPGDTLFHILIRDGAIVGRANLHGFTAASASVGYRIAEHAQGQGLGQLAAGHLVRVARELGLGHLTAKSRTDNPGSLRVLERSGFRATGDEETIPFNDTTVILRSFVLQIGENSP